MTNSWPWCKAPCSPHTFWIPFVLFCTLCCAYCNNYLVIIWEQNQPPSWDLIGPIFTFADVSFSTALIMFSDASMCSCVAQGLCWLWLQICLLLSSGRFDPTASLDFLWACIHIPRIWQGRDQRTPQVLVQFFQDSYLDGVRGNVFTVPDFYMAKKWLEWFRCSVPSLLPVPQLIA